MKPRNSREQRRVVAIVGPPAAGKSTLAQALSQELGLQWLDLDEVRVRVLPDSSQSLEDREVAYRAMHLCAELLLAAGNDVILVATYSRTRPRLQLEHICSQAGAALFIVECVVPVELAVERYRNRRDNHPATDLTQDRVRKLVKHYPYSHLGLSTDTSVSQTECLRQIRAYINTSPVRGGWAAMLEAAQ